jgi:CBS domain-containing protein
MSEHQYIAVQEVMTRSLHTISPLETVAKAMATMREHGVSSLVVERRDDRDEFGLLVVSDIAAHVIAENRAPDRVNVYEVMSKPVLALPAEMDIRNAVRLLVRFSLSRAVVVDHDRKPVGLVTMRDMVLRYSLD